MSNHIKTFTAPGGVAVFAIPADCTVSAVTVDGAGASYTAVSGVLTITPAPPIGDVVVITYSPVLSSGLGGTVTPGGAANEVQFNEAGSIGGMGKVAAGAEDNLVLVAQSTIPATNAAGVSLFSDGVGASMVNIAGDVVPIMRALGSGWRFGGTTCYGDNQGTLPFNNIALVRTTGTVAGYANSRTTAWPSLNWHGVYSSSVAGSAAQYTQAGLAGMEVWRSSLDGVGGFHWRGRMGLKPSGGLITGQSGLSGFAPTTAALGNVDPSSLTDCLLFGWDAADTELQFMHNDATGTATKVALGASFPIQDGIAIDMEIYMPPNATAVYWSARNVLTGAFARGSVTADLPTVNTMLYWRTHTRNNATAASAYIFFGSDLLMHP